MDSTWDSAGAPLRELAGLTNQRPRRSPSSARLNVDMFRRQAGLMSLIHSLVKTQRALQTPGDLDRRPGHRLPSADSILRSRPRRTATRPTGPRSSRYSSRSQRQPDCIFPGIVEAAKHYPFLPQIVMDPIGRSIVDCPDVLSRGIKLPGKPTTFSSKNCCFDLAARLDRQ